jgi:hypothetical protein
MYLCAKLNSPEANYKVSTGKKMRRVASKKVSENIILIKIKIIKYSNNNNNNNNKFKSSVASVRKRTIPAE